MGVVLTSVLTLSMWNPPPCSKCQKDMHEFSAWPPPAALWMMMMMMIHHQIIIRVSQSLETMVQVSGAPGGTFPVGP
jgi:hypothetical protein